MKMLFSFLASILWLSYIAESQRSCDDYTDDTECISLSAGACKWVNDACRCASEVELDILFGVDTSGSIGYDGFQIQKQFIETLVDQGIANGSRIGFTMFGTRVNTSREIQSWDPSELTQYVRGIKWTSGWTNTPELITTSLAEFERAKVGYEDRQQVMMIITDGNPCLPDSLGGCPQSVCQSAAQIKQDGIRVVIIGVGDGLTTEYVQCLTQSDDDFIPVASFSTSDFNDIMGSLSGIICPISKEFKITEVKAEKKDETGATTNEIWNSRWTRFVEIYNFGVDFAVKELTMSGLIVADFTTLPAADIVVEQGQYVVFYDASDEPTGLAGTGSTPSCHLCGATCDLTNCANPDDSTWGGFCWCENAVYIGCKNTASGALQRCLDNVGHNNYINGYGLCNECTFVEPTTMDRSNWNIFVWDGQYTAGDDPIDSVTYDSNTWITTENGYSYELLGKGYDNDNGDNWGQTCSVLGTPGTDPSATCNAECSNTGCGSGGSCDPDTKLCVCDKTTGYYPQCNNPNSCTKCAKVPETEDCTVLWTKNGTDRYAKYTWTDSGRSGSTEYQLSYFDGSKPNGEVTTATTYGELSYSVDNYYTGNRSYGGFVQTVIRLCEGTGANEVCEAYSSDKTLCRVITSSPTQSPTPAPTEPPTRPPTPNPTMPPTLACPRYYWSDNDKVCNPANGYAGDRCACTGNDNPPCCLLDPVWTTYDPERQHKTDFGCKLDAQLDKPKLRSKGEGQAGTSEGYLLSEGEHYFTVAANDFVDSIIYPCLMDVYWKLVFDRTDCSYGGRRRRLQGCDPGQVNLAGAGLSIDVFGGYLQIDGENDKAGGTVLINVERLECGDTIDSDSQGQDNNNQTRRRLQNGNGNDCFDGIAIYGYLEITNATSQCQPDCWDGRIYPMRIPVWYNYEEALIAVPSGEQPLPAWLWWLIAAMVVFLALLALLVYKYWWKNKATGAALNATQADLDAAVMEAEDGWQSNLAPNAVGFNPLATGFNPNAAAGAPNPNAPPDGGGNGPNFIRPNVEKPVFRMEYGQQVGGPR